MRDLRSIDVDFLTLGQYLRPSLHQLKVIEYIHPDVFDFFREEGLRLGFKYVASGPFFKAKIGVVYFSSWGFKYFCAIKLFSSV